MTHGDRCEKATGHTCNCECWGFLHRKQMITELTAHAQSDPQIVKWIRARRWKRTREDHLSTESKLTMKRRRRGLDAIVAELVGGMIDTRPSNVDLLSHLAKELAAEVERDLINPKLAGAGERGTSSSAERAHRWCYIIGAICRAFDTAKDRTNKALTRIVTEACEERFGRRITYLLKPIIRKAVKVVLELCEASNEVQILMFLRLLGVIVCPDPHTHDDVLTHCLWPLLCGFLKEFPTSAIQGEMVDWFREFYPTALPNPSLPSW